MPFKATRRHAYWSIDVRYIEHHQLPNIKGPVYVISIVENFSRMLLASAISEKQDTAAYLRVLAKVLHHYGAPEAIVTDGGGIFYSHRAMAMYEALDIRKERIDPRQSWQNYREAHFGIMRRLADYSLNKAPQLSEMRKAHRQFIGDYNTQIHFAHRERQDGRHSPKACATWRVGSYSPSADTSPHLLCDGVYPPPGSLRIHPLSPMALLR
jgi:hypothetical protein